ncbi:MAG: MATE family efflux transporter, partial [Oscillospiraceae bacterium]
MNERLAEGNINKLLWSLSIPAILGMLSGAIFNVADRIFVGKVSPLALTAVGITMPVQILQMAVILLIGVGSSTLVSIKLGEGKKQEAEDILFLAFKYIIITLIIFAVLFVIFCDPILKILSVSEQVMPYAKSYIMILIVGSVVSIPGYCLNNSMRAIGKANVSMNIILVTSVINIILDPIFIFVLDMGVAGAAFATVISQTILTVYVTMYFYKGKDLPVNLKFVKVANEKRLVKKIIINGSPSFYVQILATFVTIFTNWSLLRYGSDLDVASVTIMSTIFGFYHMVVFGIVHGNQPICGYNWGAKKYDRVLRSLQLSLLYAFILSFALFMVIEFYPAALVGMFTDDAVLLSTTENAVKLYLVMIPLIGLQTVSSQYFQSVGNARLSSLLSLLRYGVILVPAVLILAPTIGVQGIYISNAVSDFIASVVA